MIEFGIKLDFIVLIFFIAKICIFELRFIVLIFFIAKIYIFELTNYNML